MSEKEVEYKIDFRTGLDIALGLIGAGYLGGKGWLPQPYLIPFAWLSSGVTIATRQSRYEKLHYQYNIVLLS